MVWTVVGIIILLANTALIAEIHYLLRKADKSIRNNESDNNVSEDNIAQRLTTLEESMKYHIQSNNEFKIQKRLDKIEELLDIHE